MSKRAYIFGNWRFAANRSAVGDGRITYSRRHEFAQKRTPAARGCQRRWRTRETQFADAGALKTLANHIRAKARGGAPLLSCDPVPRAIARNRRRNDARRDDSSCVCRRKPTVKSAAEQHTHGESGPPPQQQRQRAASLLHLRAMQRVLSCCRLCVRSFVRLAHSLRPFLVDCCSS